MLAFVTAICSISPRDRLLHFCVFPVTHNTVWCVAWAGDQVDAWGRCVWSVDHIGCVLLHSFDPQHRCHRAWSLLAHHCQRALHAFDISLFSTTNCLCADGQRGMDHICPHRLCSSVRMAHWHWAPWSNSMCHQSRPVVHCRVDVRCFLVAAQRHLSRLRQDLLVHSTTSCQRQAESASPHFHLCRDVTSTGVWRHFHGRRRRYA